MKTTWKMLWVGMVAALCDTGNAQIIYSNSFAGGAVTINGTAPATAGTIDGGSSSALWSFTITNDNASLLANGTSDGTANTALLNFTPQAGHVYSMAASVTLPANMNGEWIAMGFTQLDPSNQTAAYARFVDTTVNGYAWMLARTGGTAADQFFGGPGGASETDSGDLVSVAGTYTLKIVLDTIGADWTTSAYVNDSQMGQTLVYGNNPSIIAAGLGQTALGSYAAGVKWNYWALSLSPLPAIAGQPVSAAVRAGAAFTNTVVLHGGIAPLAYQWYAGGVAIPGATNLSLVINPVSTNNIGNYYFVVTNNYGAVTSTVAGLAVYTGSAPVNYWVAPAAVGTGNGLSAANAASYLNASFWSTIQGQLQSGDVDVSLLNGNYSSGMTCTDLGNSLYRLALQSVNLYGPVFSTTGSTILNIVGSQNIEFYGILFNGPCTSWGVDCQPDYLKPCRNLEFSHCQFLSLTNAYYGAVGLVNGARDITFDSCTFTNITNGDHAHMIYASHDIVGVVLTNCVFQDCLADYVRFRDDSEYCVVENCTFTSTMSASAWPFLSDELYNDTDPGPGDEFFGTYFQVSGNTFTYNVSGGPGPYSALHFSDSGYSPQSYDCDLTTNQVHQLTNDITSFKQSFLQTNLGIVASGLKMFGNTYSSKVAYHVDYAYSWDDTNAPYGGWQGTINLSDVPDASGALLGPPPVMRNGNFDKQGLLDLPVTSSTPNECLFQTWFCNPKYADILSHPGFNGTTNAMRFGAAVTQYIYQWISNPTPAWTMDCLFALGSAFTGTGTKFKVDIFHDDITGSKVSVGVDNLGRFGIYNGGTFTILPGLGTVVFSIDNNGNGLYTDPGDTLNVYRLRIVGNYAAATPYVNIYSSSANSPVLDHQSLGLTYWVNDAPASGQSAPGTIAFYNYTAPVVVDQIALAAGLAGQPPVINHVSLGGRQFIISGTNGFSGDTYYILSSTNLTLPPTSWTPLATNTFDGTGSFGITNIISAGAPQIYYRLQLQ